ncbi:hypothetical protein ACFYKT_18105 [Cytobacillus sp. FJAT-53684]|uniref:Uncharacterized protein n=1 Tax=Cytobacillus mangrovibacter TaxID=3299024 RepID=A0ABW6K253_9BACI
MVLLRENSVKKYAQYRQSLEKSLSGNKSYQVSLYDSFYFEEKDGEVYVKFKDYGKVFHENQFERVYIIDLDKDILLIKNTNNRTQQEIKRA